MTVKMLDRGVIVRVVGLTRSSKSFGLLVREEHVNARKEGVIIGSNPLANNVFFVVHSKSEPRVIGIYGAEELELIDVDDLSAKIDALRALIIKGSPEDPT